MSKIKTLLIILLLSGCSVGRDYEPPAQDLPQNWEGPVAEVELSAGWLKPISDPILQQLLNQAVEHNFDYKAAVERVAEAYALRKVAGSLLRPGIDLDAQYRRSLESQNLASLPGGEEENEYSAGAVLSWEIDIFGRIRRGVEVAEAELGGAEAARRAVLQSILSSVADQYIALRASQQQLIAVEGNLQAQKTSTELVRTRVTAGLDSELDLARSQALESEIEAETKILYAAIDNSIHQLEALTGDRAPELRQQLNVAAKVPQAEAWPALGVPSDLLRRRPDLMIAERTLAADTAQYGIAMGAFYPRFSIDGAIGYRAQLAGDWFDSGSDFYSVVPGFSWPILTWRRLRDRLEASDARTRVSLYSYQQAILNSLAEVEGALSLYKNLHERTEVLSRNLEANERAADLANQQYRAGLIDFLDKLDAERNLYRARERYVASQGLIARQYVTLCKALGGGWEEYEPK